MTTPPEEPASEPSPDPAAKPAPEPADATAPTAAVPPTAPPTPPAQPYAYPHPAFAPVPRAPREPWVNPAKRVPAAIAAGLIAIVLIGGGFAAGFATGHHDGDRAVRVRFQPGLRDDFPGMPMGPGYRDRGHRMYPPNLPTPSTTPSPSASG